MAGVKLIPVGGQELDQELLRLINAARDPAPALRDIGEYLDLAHRMRWDKSQSPEGTRWTPLLPATLLRKRQRKQLSEILTASGNLRDLLRYQVNARGLTFGTNREYGATHHFGRPEANIPARPWLGVSDADRKEVVDITRRHLEGSASV